MKNYLITLFVLLAGVSHAQVGIGTTSPNSTLDVRGSISGNYRAFSSGTMAGTSDYVLVFTGTSPATLTLPDATTVTGRTYQVKNASSNSSLLTLATTSAQTIDGLSTWPLSVQNKTLILVSNGTNWYAVAESVPGSSGTPWVLGGNNVPSMQNLGTTANYALPFITNNTEKMRLTTTGNLGIGTSTFDGTNPEKLLVDAGSASSFNVISGKGTIDNYLQLNIQNRSSGTSASSDVVATADNGNETVNYVDMGINSSGYSSGTFTITGINDAYLYSTGNDFAIGNATSNKSLKFFTGGTLAANERMRINQNGNVAIGATSWDGTYPEKLLVDAGTTSSIYPFSMKGTNNGWFQSRIRNNSTGSAASADYVAVADNGSIVDIGVNCSGYSSSAIYGGAGMAYLFSSGNDFVIGNQASGKNLRFFTGGSATSNERMRISSTGDVAIGTTTFDGTNPEQLIVDAGTTSSFNVISGKGSIDNYLQLNIQNRSSGNSASSDVVATADNGNETVNFIDMGINSSTYSSSGILSGADNAYLYSTGNDFIIGNATASKNILFFTGGTATTNERLRISSAGNIGVGNITPNSTMDVNGSAGFAITTTASNITLDGTHYTVILTGGTPTVTLPAAASGNSRRIYVIVNQTGAGRTISTYKDFAGASSTTIAANSSITIQSNGTNWYRIQ